MGLGTLNIFSKSTPLATVVVSPHKIQVDIA
jgi:hypothetical protein